MNSVTIRQGHVLDVLRAMPPEYCDMAARRIKEALGMTVNCEVVSYE